MLASIKISYRATPEDKEILSRLAMIVRRNESDTLRWVVRETLKAFEGESQASTKTSKTPKQKN